MNKYHAWKSSNVHTSYEGLKNDGKGNRVIYEKRMSDLCKLAKIKMMILCYVWDITKKAL